MQILWLNKKSNDDALSLGEKAHLLHQLSTSGLPVPRTFVVPSEFFETLLRTNGLDEELRVMYNAQSIGASDQMQQRVLKMPLSKEMISIILSAYECIDEERANLKETFQRMGITNRHEPFVAVKSSYIFPQGVPLPKKQITLLNASSNSEVIEAIKHCWASLFSEELLQHREQYQLDLFDLNMSVMVQQMVYPRKSGTIFVDQGRKKATIRAGLGLGEAIVSDLVESDTYSIDLENLQIDSVDIRAQQWRFTINRNEGKIVREELSQNEQNMQFLSKEELQSLARLVKDLPFEEPTWIEWCQEQDKYSFINCWQERKMQKNLDVPVQEEYETDTEQPQYLTEEPQANQIIESEESYLSGTTDAQDSFIKLTEAEAQNQETQTIPALNSPLSKEFHTKYLHDVSQLLISCDMAINAVLKEKHQEIYGTEPEERFFELIAKMREHMEIPETIAKVRLLRNKYLDSHTPVDVPQVLEAIDTTKSFLEKFS